MKTLQKLYGLRIFLGLFAAFISVGYGVATETIIEAPSTAIFFNGLSLAVIFYVVSYYLVKAKVKLEAEKQRKLLTTGIGIYFISWILFWILMYTWLLKN